MTIEKQIFEMIEKVNAAIEAHPTLQLVQHHSPTFTIDMHGCSVYTYVKKGRVKSRISGTGDTCQEAADTLIAELDIWAEVI